MTDPKTSRGWQWLVVIALISLSACSKHTELNSGATVVPFKTLDGEKFSLSELPGWKLVNFWSTSCVICIKEMPDLAELHEDYESRGLTVIAVAIPSDRPDLVLNFSQQQNLPFPVALDVDGSVLAAFGSVKGTPTTFLIDANGEQIGRFVGKIKFEALREKLDGVLTIGHLPIEARRLAAATVSP